MLHQVGVSFHLYYDAQKHKIKIPLTYLNLYRYNYNQNLFNWNAVGGQSHNWDAAYIIKCWIDIF